MCWHLLQEVRRVRHGLDGEPLVEHQRVAGSEGVEVRQGLIALD